MIQPLARGTGEDNVEIIRLLWGLCSDFRAAVGPGEDQHFGQQEDQDGSDEPFPEVAAADAGSFDADRFVGFQPAVTVSASSVFEGQRVQRIELRFLGRAIECQQG